MKLKITWEKWAKLNFYPGAGVRAELRITLLENAVTPTPG